MNTIEFEVHNQTLVRVDSKEILNSNKDMYKAVFTFDEESEWTDLNKFVIFTDGWGNTVTQHIGKTGNVLSCLIPSSVLSGSYFKVSVYAGDLITTNSITISLIQSGYKRQPLYHHPHHKHHHYHRYGCDDYMGKDIFVEIFDQLESSVDSIIYDDKTLILFNRDKILDSIYLPFLTEEEIKELVSNLTLDYITIPLASDTHKGLMSNEDKIKLDGIDENANHIVIDDELDGGSDNPVSNRALSDKFDSLDSQVNDLNETVDGLESLETIVDEHGNRINGLDESLETIRVNLDGKEDNYDYVERLDNIIVNLINQGE